MYNLQWTMDNGQRIIGANEKQVLSVIKRKD